MLKIIKTLYSKQKTILVCPLIKNACYNKKKLYLHNIFTDCRSKCLQERGFKLLLYSVTLCATCELQRPYLSHSCLSASKVETKQDPNKKKKTGIKYRLSSFPAATLCFLILFRSISISNFPGNS